MDQSVQEPKKPLPKQTKEISFLETNAYCIWTQIKIPALTLINTSIGQPMEDPIQPSLMNIFRDRKLFEDSYTKSTQKSR